MRTFCIIWLTICLSSCVQDINDLELNPFEDDSIIMLEVTEVDYNPLSWSTTLHFDVFYDWEADEDLKGVVLVRDGVNVASTNDPSMLSLSEYNLPFTGYVCYHIGFLTKENLVAKPTEEICFDL